MKTFLLSIFTFAVLAGASQAVAQDAVVDRVPPATDVRKVPEAATTVALLGASLAGIELLRRRFSK